MTWTPARSLVFLALALLLSSVAAAAELKVDGVSMTFDLPDGWEIESSDATGQQHLVNREVKSDVMPMPTPGTLVKSKYGLPGVSRADALRQTLTQGFGPMLEQMTSEEPEVRPIPNSEPESFYIAAEQPDGRHMIVGATFQNGTELMMMGSAGAQEDVAEVLAIMASVRITGPQNTALP